MQDVGKDDAIEAPGWNVNDMEISSFLATPAGRTLIERIEQAEHEYVATLTPLPLAELTRLADLLEAIAQRLWQASESAIKAHQACCHRLPITTPAPMVRLDARCKEDVGA